MKLLSRSTFTLAALLLSTGFTLAAEAIDFKTQWQVGKKYSQLSKMAQSTSISMGATKMDQKVAMTSETAITVKAHEDGQHKRLLVKYGRIQMDMDMAGQKMTFDSASPDGATDPIGIGKMLSGLADKEIRIVVDGAGKVTDVENAEELAAALAAAGPAAAQFSSMFNKDYFARTIEQAGLYNVPPQPVQPGATWPQTFSMNLPRMGQVQIKGTYEFTQMTDRDGVACAEVQSKGKLEMNVNPNPAGGEAGEMLKKLGFGIDGGEVSGTVWFDPKLGMARETELNQTMTAKMNNPANAGESMLIPITQKVTTTLVKVEDVK